ncbi:PD-(D/E)XK nuclease family protein [Roseibacillus persicicus]|uniref:PD-(D/E)XK nuclease family protein n=1 Tax=Roseibacillus persicicus TaxID=454148 RepID=UPI00398BB2F8
MTAPTALQQIEKLFEELTLLEQSESQATFLSIGGRGYYENPASDLLLFFFRPDNAHGLGTLFIDAFLEASNFKVNLKATGTLTVQREQGTNDRKRIDLVVSNSTWLLMIENKIWHHQNNPFDSYEELADNLANGRELYFAVLSPSGDSERDNWMGVSYANFINAIDRRLTSCTAEQKVSKWFHFAQDFTLHLTQELYQQAMTPDEIAFVEKHQQQLDQTADLQMRYREHMKEHLCQLSNKTSNTEGAWAKIHDWAIRVYHPIWKNSDIAWWHDRENNHNLTLNVYLSELSEGGIEKAKACFGGSYGMEYWTENNGRYHCWTTRGTLLSKQEAEGKFQTFARELNQLWAAE